MGISDGIPPRWKSSNPKIRPADCSAGQDPLPARISCRNRMATGQIALVAHYVWGKPFEFRVLEASRRIIATAPAAIER